MTQAWHLTTPTGVNPALFNQLDTLLFSVCDKLRLTKTQREKIESAYKAVGDILRGAAEGSVLHEIKLGVYAQGSLLTGTSVKPLASDEFDLDVVILFHLDWEKVNPKAIQDEIYNILEAHGTYKGKVEKKSRCVRINYKGDFHVDLMPACPKELGWDHDEIKVPFLKTPILVEWQNSNPKGIGKWFLDISELSSRKRLHEVRLAKADVEQEGLPDELRDISNLVAIVILIKRARDHFFTDDPDSGKICRSIALLVMAGEYYEYKGSLIGDFIHIVDRMIEKTSNPYNLHIYNPVQNHLPEYEREDFAEKWKQDRNLHTKFRSWILSLREDLLSLFHMNPSKAHDYADLLKKLFKDGPVDQVFNDLGQAVNNALNSGKLFSNGLNGAPIGVSMGAAVSSASAKPIEKIRSFGSKTLKFKKSKTGKKELSLIEQNEIMKFKWPGFSYSFDRSSGEMVWKGRVRPSLISDEYTIQVRLKKGFHPKVFVLSHDLGGNCIHTYPEKELCLYHKTLDPEGWNRSKRIASTIIPWAIIWLLHWETWLVTGKWNGEEFPHERSA